MDLDITKERDMPLMSRKRYTLFADFKGPTPKRIDLRDAIAKKVKGEPELTVVKHIYTRYGVQKAKVIAHVYNDKKDMARYEGKVLLDKHVAKKEEKTEKKKAPAEAPAAPAEKAKPAEPAAEKKPVEAPAAEEKKEAAAEKTE